MDDNRENSDEAFELDVHYDLICFLKDYPVVKAYLASPLTDVPQDRRELLKAARRSVRQVLASCGTHQFQVYDPADHTPPGSDHTPSEVYATDRRHVENADVVFFFVVGPSTGMGMEAHIAAQATVPRVVIQLRGMHVTRMFVGAPTRELAKIEFASPDEISPLLTNQASRIGEEAARSRKLRDEASSGGFVGIGIFLLKRRIESQVSLDDLSVLTDQTVEWLRKIERDPDPSALMSVPLLQRISRALEIDMVVDPNHVSVKSRPDRGLSPTTNQSLENLVQFVLSRSPIDDRRILQLWRSYRDERQMIEREALAGREDINRSVEIERWKELYEQRSLFQ